MFAWQTDLTIYQKIRIAPIKSGIMRLLTNNGGRGNVTFPYCFIAVTAIIYYQGNSQHGPEKTDLASAPFVPICHASPGSVFGMGEWDNLREMTGLTFSSEAS